VHTYANVIEHIDKPGTHLNQNWANLPAPSVAKNYWVLGEDATWRDTLRHILADEAHHRDVNHTYAGGLTRRMLIATYSYADVP
jgi:hypothetical protein